MKSSSRWPAVGAGFATALLLAFLALPIVAILVRVPPAELFRQLSSRVALDALAVSIRTSVVALALICLMGTPAAYVLSRATWRGSAMITTLVELPLVLPPAVAGIGLLAAFGRMGLVGRSFQAVGLTIPFTQGAVVMAMTFVAIPFYVRQAVAAFQGVDPQLMAAARSLGAGPGRTFLRVALPMAAPGLSAGATLAWARSLGEFGATLIFAGSLQGRTQTLPLAIYAELQVDFPGALAIATLLLVVSGALLVATRLVARSARAARTFPWIPLASPSRSSTA